MLSNNQTQRKLAYNLSEAAKFAGVSRPTMMEWVHIPGFPAFKTGRRWVISAAAFERWIDERAYAGGNVRGD